MKKLCHKPRQNLKPSLKQWHQHLQAVLKHLPVVEVMDVQSVNKLKEHANPETTIEPRGKAGRPATSGARASRPKVLRAGTERMNAEKRDGSSPEEEPKMRKKRRQEQRQS